jgi:hypothetical protein
LFINNNWGTSRRRTQIIDIEPSLWWSGELWRQGEEEEWTGCIMEMVHEIMPIDELQDRPVRSESLRALDNELAREQ